MNTALITNEESVKSANTGPFSGAQRKDLKFVDLFAGLGGFHVGLSRLGLECVFASELDSTLQEIYLKNFGLKPSGDIRKVREDTIEAHDVLCAGFPCQPFSLAGKKKGAKCPESGKLIDDVIRIVQYHRPKYVLLENVPNILTIEDGKFWNYIEKSFQSLGYEIDYHIYSPHEFGIPQKRERVFVVASKSGLSEFKWPTPSSELIKSVNELVPQQKLGAIREIEPAKLRILECWQNLVQKINTMSHHSIVSSEFGADYPLDGFHGITLDEAKSFKGAFGCSLESCESWEQLFKLLPKYAATKNGIAPEWIRSSLTYSRLLYLDNKDFLDKWKQSLINAPSSWQKLEWRGSRDTIDIWQHIIQFRASGIRILRMDHAPSLVAMTPTQTPILGPKKRYLCVSEAAALQSLDELLHFPKLNSKVFKALGNAVNAFVVKEIAENLIK